MWLERDWCSFWSKRFETYNPTVARNIVFGWKRSSNIEQACISKYNSKWKNGIILLMITDDQK